MFRALISSSSGGTVYTIGITLSVLCRLAASRVAVELNSNPASSQPTLYAGNIPVGVYTVLPDEEQISDQNM
jgi:hypothetical protein